MYHYVIVRTNMSASQIMVQAAHAALVAQEQITKFRDLNWVNVPPAKERTLIILAAKNKAHLWWIRFKLTVMADLAFKVIAESQVYSFVEPEPWEKGSGGLTAISFFSRKSTIDRYFVRNLPLVKLYRFTTPAAS
jgi:hypothetical protein